MKRSFFQSVASFFAFLCILFIPFPFNITKVQSPVTDLIFGRLIGSISSTIFGKTLKQTRVYSDSVSMYILVLLLFILAILISGVLLRVKKWPEYREKIFGFVYRLCFYYLALQLLKYGLGKVFKSQFYMPEPNTLYTPMGKAGKSLLFWSSMGTSWSYNVFLGLLEAFAAIFILIKRTRLVGLLMSLGIMLNVAAINFGFDISVKLFSLFLLYLTIYLLVPYFRRLYPVLLNKPVHEIPVADPVVLFPRSFITIFFKWLVVGVIFLEAFYPSIKTGNFNDDIAKRPYLHGAYDVQQMITGTDTLSAANSPVKRFFVHRQGYMIFQDQEDAMEDYRFTYDTEMDAYVLTDYKKNKTPLSIVYQQQDSVLVLQYLKGNKSYQLTGKAIDWRKLPALQKGFHWTVDGRP